MKQLVQQLRNGAIEVVDVAIPSLGAGMLLVQSHYSLVSAGTEASTVTTARKSLLGKAMERPDQVKQVIESVKQQGVVQTYRAVSKRLDSYSPLGYSSAGVVIGVGEGINNFTVGDLVACAGVGYACHAEVVSVPANLCVRLPSNADLLRAAYNTLGAIALQGIRQADLRLGETCIVIGLGLLGQLTSLMLRASGINVIGLDINSKAIAVAKKHSVSIACPISDSNLPEVVLRETHGIGADAVIITAATNSTQPVNVAGQLLRKRGIVVVVGNVPTGFDRDPDYYRKELSLRMSCSYGPGRYDLSYEEKGHDYPPGYVRWTENRNMQAFQDLVHSGAINLDFMTTHNFNIDDAAAAYDLMISKSSDYLGIIIAYDSSKNHSRKPIRIENRTTPESTECPGIGFIGAGSYAASHLLPNLPTDGSVRLTGVLTSSGTTSRSVAEKFGFEFVASSHDDIINDGSTDVVFVATRHDSHAQYVEKALAVGKDVFVEKPLCLTRMELTKVLEGWRKHRPRLMVGYNRRFSPLATRLKESMGSGPVAMLYRVNAGSVPADSWIQDVDVGGGRIVGEVCHFIDFMIFMNGSLPTRINANSMKEPKNLLDTVCINLSFENGSIGSISYFANGPKSLPKEYVEVYCDGTVGRLLDFKELEILGGKRPVREKLMTQNKGQRNMVQRFIASISSGSESPIPIAEILASTLATLDALESLRTGQGVDILLPSDQFELIIGG